jgi:hypothetical protein
MSSVTLYPLKLKPLLICPARIVFLTRVNRVIDRWKNGRKPIGNIHPAAYVWDIARKLLLLTAKEIKA